MVRVLVVDDSPTTRLYLRKALGADPEIEVVGWAGNGEDAIAQVHALHPDIVTMDIFMPGMDGLEATRRIMESHPVPIVVISSGVDQPELMIAFQAIQAGALEVLPKPGLGAENVRSVNQRLTRTIKLLADVKVIRRRVNRQARSSRDGQPQGVILRSPVRMVAIAASTGGPAALNRIVKDLPADFPVPVAVVQHISSGFLQSLVKWLRLESRNPIEVVADGTIPEPGTIYFAPEGRHLEVASDGRFVHSSAPPVHYVRPSASVLFRSLAHVWGSAAVGVVLTGMGDDGAPGLKEMHDRGASIIAQDEGTSAVYGMPEAAVRAGAVDFVLPLDEITSKIVDLAGRVSRRTRSRTPHPGR